MQQRVYKPFASTNRGDLHVKHGRSGGSTGASSRPPDSPGVSPSSASAVRLFFCSLGALVYIRSNGKGYLLGGGLGFTLASSYLASLGGLWVGGVCTAKREGGHCVGGRVSRQDLVGQHAMRPKR